MEEDEEEEDKTMVSKMSEKNVLFDLGTLSIFIAY